MLSRPPLRHPVRRMGGQVFDFDRELVVMGIVNRTPDSFFDGGRSFSLNAAVAAATAAAAAGARWVDIGGVPFSPEVTPVSEAEEIDRVVPVVASVADACDVVISVDTVRPRVAEEAIAAGASVINDTSSLHDPALAEVVANTAATLVITHSLAAPGQRLAHPTYADVVDEVRARLLDRVRVATALGVPEERIVLDPGHDLNKTTRHSLELTRRLDEIAALGFPVLVAVSNKDFVGEATGLAKPDRTEASLAAATVCVLHGARILRMHDVRAAVRAAALLEAVLGGREPAFEQHNL